MDEKYRDAMKLGDDRPPMLKRTARQFPICVEEPETVNTGEVFIEDLESLGPWEVDPRTFVRALCTIGEEVSEYVLDDEAELEKVRAEDRCTSWLHYDTDVVYQVEIFIDGQGFGPRGGLLPIMNMLTPDEDTRLLVVADKGTMGIADAYKKGTDGVEVFPVISEPQESVCRLKEEE